MGIGQAEFVGERIDCMPWLKKLAAIIDAPNGAEQPALLQSKRLIGRHPDSDLYNDTNLYPFFFDEKSGLYDLSRFDEAYLSFIPNEAYALFFPDGGRLNWI